MTTLEIVLTVLLIPSLIACLASFALNVKLINRNAKLMQEKKDSQRTPAQEGGEG